MKHVVLALGLVACTKPDEPKPAPPAVASVQNATTMAPVASSPAPSADRPVPLWVDAAPNADFASTVRLERAKATRAGRMLVVYVGADWCPPCKAFHEAILAHQLDQQLAKVTFLVFDFDRDASKMGAFGYQTTHIPYFVKPGPDGAPEAAFNIKTLNKPEAVKEATAKLVAWQTP